LEESAATFGSAEHICSLTLLVGELREMTFHLYLDVGLLDTEMVYQFKN